MRNLPSMLIAAAIAVGAASAASAQPPVAMAPFAGMPVSDLDLAAIRGSGVPFASPTRRQVAGLADLQSQFDARMFGVVARVQMDVWWGSEGATLIAQEVRANLPIE